MWNKNNNSMSDRPLHFHHSFNSLLDTFRNVIAAMTSLKATIKNAQAFYKDYPYIITLACSVTNQEIKIDKSILSLIEIEGFNKGTPLYSQTLINFYRIFTIAIKDIVWEEPDFSNLLDNSELQFLRHIRNASAHNNKFYWGKGLQRANTISDFPVMWRGKEINESLEGTELYMNFLKPGDLFLLLVDISNLCGTTNVKLTI